MKKLFYQIKNIIKKILPHFLLDWYHFSLAFLAALIYGFPSRKLKVIGITGTSGKSTVLEMTSNILEEAGYKVASLSSIRFRLAGKEESNNLRMTLPGRFFVQRFLRKAVNYGCEYAVLEITSEGIKQHRHSFIDFKVAALTNLSPEHIEAHGGFEKYKQAKQKLFKVTKRIHVINLDDENSKFFLGFPAKEKYLYGINKEPLNNNFKFIKAAEIQTGDKGVKFVTEGTEFNLQILGKFNVYNALAAISIAKSQGVGLRICKKSLESFKGMPGRMEKVVSAPFKVFVDYAITPNALEKVYETLVKNHKPKNNQLICVFGSCGGGRDKWKRPVLGEIASRYCNQIILTNEDPYDENPDEILAMIKSGTLKAGFSTKNLYEIVDRRMAIRKGLELAKPDDIVIITGKGCESSICLAKGERISWSDKLTVQEALESPTPRYQFLEHRADLKIQVFGRTKEELFLNAMLAMIEYLKPDFKHPETNVEQEITVKSTDSTTLLADFLNEALYLIQVNKEIYSRVSFDMFTNKEITAKLSGQKVEAFGEDIKAVTYHNLEINQKNNSWEAIVLFDI